MSDLEAFKAEVEAFMAAASMTPTEFGKQHAHDPGFVFGLRDGREPREATRRRILDSMHASINQTEHAA